MSNNIALRVEKRKKAEELVANLEKAGVNASLYVRNPLGRVDVFAIAVSKDKNREEGNIKIYPGIADLDLVATDKKHRQAILEFQEDGHTVKQKTSYIYYSNILPSDNGIKKDLIAQFRSSNNFPGKVRYSVKSDVKFYLGNYSKKRPYTKEEILKHKMAESEYIFAEGTVVVNVSAQNQKFLVGMDETNHFICALPKKLSEKVKSVKDAHDVLMPEEVKKARTPYKRQGEFFFVQVPQKLAKKLTSMLSQSSSNVPLERRSSHSASVGIKLDDGFYVNGVITDDRPGRHTPILLEGWHKVIRNREIKVSQNEVTDKNRMTTWD